MVTKLLSILPAKEKTCQLYTGGSQKTRCGKPGYIIISSMPMCIGCFNMSKEFIEDEATHQMDDQKRHARSTGN
jgi:hypothetical protein